MIQSAAPAETEGAGDTAAKAQNTAETNGALSGTEVAAKISPSVVSITTEQMEVGQFWFGPQVVSGAGSGVIISEDGYILTDLRPCGFRRGYDHGHSAGRNGISGNSDRNV